MVMVPTSPTDGDDQGNSDCCGGGISPSSISTTNWQISHGSLESTVTFESSDSPFDPDSTPKSPLIVKPHSPDSSPCEIKVCFAQKHEIQQVYVRSTARVYEIYYAPSLHGENVYLCTVRCHAAEREGEILLAGIEDASKQHMEIIKECPGMEKFTGKGKTGSSSEEEWVDVEVPGVPIAENGQAKQSVMNGGRIIEELCEATAEIRDAEPCASLTIRLLSLQSKDCLYVDEVYIFGDPFVSIDSENRPISVENSAQSSLMAMLVPTILQLSKSAINRTTDTYSFDDRQRKDDDEGLTVRKADMNDDTINGIHCEQRSMIDEENENLHVDTQLTFGAVQSMLPAMDHNRMEQVVANGNESQPADEKNNAPDIGRLLGQLVDRVNRIEDICLRFEETMLKPINSMEVRLQRVEEQLEVLAKNSQYTGLPSCKRFMAPSFSCTDSNFGSFYNDGNDPPPNLASELKMDCPDDDKLSPSCKRFMAPSFSCTDSNFGSFYNDGNDHPPNLASESRMDCPGDASSLISANSPHIHPSLVIAAPEFSCGEEEEDSHALEHLKNSPADEGKRKPLSIDDALAAALSGFLSTSAISIPESSKKIEVSLSEPNGEPLESGPEGPILRNERARDETIQAITITAPEFALEDLADFKDNTCEGASNETILEGSQTENKPETVESGCEVAGDDNSDGFSDDHSVNPIGHVVNEEPTSNYTLGGNQTDTKPETMGSGGDDATKESSKDVLLESQHSPVPCLDFDTPILEVNFGSREEDSGTTLPLEVLLGGGGDTEGIYVTETDFTISDCDSGIVPLANSDSLVDYICANVDERTTDPCADQGVFVESLI